MECAICLEEDALSMAAMIAPCGHSFCSPCLATLSSRSRGAVQCPTCRQRAHLMCPCYALRRNRVVDDEDALAQADLALKAYNAQFDGSNVANLRLGLSSVLSWSSLTHLPRLLVMVCVGLQTLYVLSPVDLLPEASLGLIGFLDDIVFFLVMLVVLGSFLRPLFQH